jgi:hypothetical protein
MSMGWTLMMMKLEWVKAVIYRVNNATTSDCDRLPTRKVLIEKL